MVSLEVTFFDKCVIFETDFECSLRTGFGVGNGDCGLV